MAVIAWMRLSLKGQLPGGEVFSINPTFRLTEPTNVGNPSSMASSIASALVARTIPTNIINNINSQSSWTSIRVELRTGDFSLQGVGEVRYASPKSGSGTTPHPPQTAIVASLRTSLPGRSGRGRLYLPMTGFPLQPNLQMLEAQATAIVTDLRTWLRDLANTATAAYPAPGPDHVLVVHSRKTNTAQDVISIQADTVLDTQRRRRDKLVGSRAEVTY